MSLRFNPLVFGGFDFFEKGGEKGEKGEPGAPGAEGPRGFVGGESAVWQFIEPTTTPEAKHVSFNAVTGAGTTAIYINDQSWELINALALVQDFRVGDSLEVIVPTVPGLFDLFEITSHEHVGSVTKLGVTFIANSTGSPPYENNSLVTLTIAHRGPEGLAGKYPAGGASGEVITWKEAGVGQWGKVKNTSVEAAAGLEESKLSLPNVVKTSGNQTIEGVKKFTTTIEGTGLTLSEDLIVPLIEGLKKLVASEVVETKGFFAATPFAAPELTASVNDWEPQGVEGANGYSVIELKATAEWSITGLRMPFTRVKGIVVVFHNRSTSTIPFTHEDALSSAGNRFSFPKGEAAKIPPKGSLTVFYSPINRWCPIAATGVAI